MKKYSPLKLIICLLIINVMPLLALTNTHHKPAIMAVNPCNEFNNLNAQVRDGLINREVAQDKIKELMPRIKEYFYKNGGSDIPSSQWVFPLQGYGPRSIGGSNGSGYITSGYDFFAGNRHGGHPAHDIFIQDRNQDNLDDNTKKPVNVLSMSGGIVVTCVDNWDVNSELRGGKYIGIYDPQSESIFYYAHNSEVFVTPGKLVKPGDVIAEVGRTGKSAYAKRSPTHLHIMLLVIKDGYPKPENLYGALLKAKLVK